MSRLLGIGLNIGRRAASVVSPITIVGSSLREWLNGDCGIDVGTGNWTGCKNGNVGTPNAAPLYNPSLLNGHGGWSWARGSAQRHTFATLDLPAPPFTIYAIVRQDAWNSGGTLVGNSAGLGAARILQGGASPQLQMNNTSAVNTNGGLAVGAWGRVIAEFTNSTSDRIQAGATNVTGANAGAANPGAGVQISAAASGAHCSQSATDYLFIDGLLSAAQITALDDWAVTLYGAISV